MRLHSALLDADVLYRVPIQDVLLQRAVMDVYWAKWVTAIHTE